MKINLVLILPFILLLSCKNHSEKGKSLTEEGKEVLVRNAHAMAYNSKDSEVYFFGGANDKEVLSDLWVLDGQRWRKIVTARTPKPRTFASLIYDSENDRLVLFGGSKVLFGQGPDSQNLLNDTWQFSNNRWKKLITDNAPSPRAETVMVFDKSRNTIVLFGGYKIQNGEYIKLKDTWEFHHNDWHLVSADGPSERHGVSMAYHTEDKSVILFGGSTIDKQYGKSKGETWKWNGKEWNKLEIEQPTGMFNATMVYHEEQRELIRFGGWDGKSRVDQTWSFRDNKWDMLAIDYSPTSRNHSAMVYDEKEKRIVLFGGHDGEQVFGDIWEYTNMEWRKISESEPVKRKNNGH
ncbi:MAG: kelch repeat-containing protein [Bacteroidota bacterium]